MSTLYSLKRGITISTTPLALPSTDGQPMQWTVLERPAGGSVSPRWLSHWPDHHRDYIMTINLTRISHSLILSREGLILTLSILSWWEGWISWSIPVDRLMMRKMSVFHQNWGGIGKSIPSPSRFLSTLKISLGLRPREISWVSGNILTVRDGFPNTSLVLVEHGYIPFSSKEGNL